MEKLTIEERVVKLEERVRTLFFNYSDFKENLIQIERNQTLLLEQVNRLNSILNTLKYVLGLFFLIFGTVFSYILWEIIKII